MAGKRQCQPDINVRQLQGSIPLLVARARQRSARGGMFFAGGFGLAHLINGSLTSCRAVLPCVPGCARPRRKISVATSRSLRPSSAARSFISLMSSTGKSSIVFMKPTFQLSIFLPRIADWEPFILTSPQMKSTPVWLLRGLEKAVPRLDAADRKLPPTHIRVVVRSDRFARGGASGGLPRAFIQLHHRREIGNHS